jgi:predicted RNA-binding protein with PUA-like domain
MKHIVRFFITPSYYEPGVVATDTPAVPADLWSAQAFQGEIRTVVRSNRGHGSAFCVSIVMRHVCIGAICCSIKPCRRSSMPNYWLFKTEPSVYSFQQLQKDKKTVWDGVANNLALKNLKDIKKGDLVFIYHTGDERQAVGIARALGGAYPDPSKKDPKLLVVDVEAVKPLPRPVTLAEVKADKQLANFDLVRNSRLSIMKVSDEQWEIMEGMAKQSK